MLLTGGLLGLLYVLFGVALFVLLNGSIVLMVVIVIGLAFFQYYTSDKLALAASGAKVVSAEEAPRAARDGRAALRDGEPAQAAHRRRRQRRPERLRDRPEPEARGGRRDDGLWRRLEPQEIEAVLAHELSHIANRDVLVMTVASFFAMLAALLTRFGLYAGMFGASAAASAIVILRHAAKRRPEPLGNGLSACYSLGVLPQHWKVIKTDIGGIQHAHGSML